MTDKQRYQFKQIIKQATEQLHNDKINFSSDLQIRTAASIINSYALDLAESAAETAEEAERRAANKHSQ
jgi:histone H3/H4